MRIIRTTLIAASLLISCAVPADEYRFSVGLATTHTVPGDWNERNQLVVGEYRHAFAGTFVNSFGDRSFTAGGVARYSARFIEIELRAGAVTGYKPEQLPVACLGDVCPAIAYGANVRLNERVSVGITQFYNAVIFPLSINF